ncbi:MAG: molybdate ABC transporter permease subunit [Chloroflexi bacterium]|nr:molybdate ABC transporter permease subunit [Chloroflexota bacterium]
MAVIVAIGTPLAYLFARFQFPLKRILNTLIELPIVMPPVVAGLALLMAFGRRGLLGAPLEMLGITLPFSLAAVLMAQVFVSAPFYIRAAQLKFQSIPRELEEAASIDGADRWREFWFVTLPLSLPGLLMGLILSWARALGEFGATILFAGSLQGSTQTMPLLVYAALERDIHAALWAGLILIGLAVLALGVVRWMGRQFGEAQSIL